MSHGRGTAGHAWQVRRVVALGPDRGPARIELPAVRARNADTATAGAPTHLRLDAWWAGDEPLEIQLEAADGVRRIVVLATSSATALPADVGEPLDLSHGAAPIDLPLAARWVRIHGEGLAWARVSLRQPAARQLEDEDGEVAWFGGDGGELRELSQQVLGAADDASEANARLLRAEWLLDAALEGYARRDIAAAGALPGSSPATLRALGDLDQATRAWNGPDHVTVHDPDGRAALPLDLAASAGRGAAAWLDALDLNDDARLLAADRLGELAGRHPRLPAIRRELARRALADAREEPAAALAALLHGIAVREVVDDAVAAGIVGTALEATRPDPLLAADRSHDRVWLSSAAAKPDALAEPAAWARWTMLGAGMERVDRVLAAGTRWVVAPAPGAPTELVLTAVCDDMRVAAVDAAPTCQLVIEHVDRIEDWNIQRGQTSRRSLVRQPDQPLTVALADGGRARYAALALDSGDGGWQVPDRRAAYHVARPGQPVRFTHAGPTRLTVEAAGRYPGPERPLPHSEIRVDGELRATLGGGSAQASSRTDQGVAYGPVEQADLSVEGDDVHRIEIQGLGGAVAVRVTRRMAAERVLPELPSDTPGEGDLAAGAMVAAAGSPVAMLPRPAAGGTVELRAMVRDRWSVDFEPVDERDVFVELGGVHRVRAAEGPWLRGGVFGRVRFASTPSAGLQLGIHQRIRPGGLRWGGQLTGLVQSTDLGTRGALGGRLRIDRPIRLGFPVTLVPHLDLRGYLQPRDELDAIAGEADLEIASRYRREHPFGLGAGAELLWRPWVEAELLLAGRVRSNADPATVDSAGGRVEVRAYPRPVGVAVRYDLDRRMADAHRDAGWWRSELALEAWADLGPAQTWIRPEIRLAYLFDPSRLEVSAGIALIPGRRALDHVSPPELLFEDVRGPAWVEGGWRR